MLAKGDVGAVAHCVRYYGGWADKLGGKTIDVAPDMFHYTREEPVSPSPAPTGGRLPWLPLLLG